MTIGSKSTHVAPNRIKIGSSGTALQASGTLGPGPGPGPWSPGPGPWALVRGALGLGPGPWSMEPWALPRLVRGALGPPIPGPWAQIRPRTGGRQKIKKIIEKLLFSKMSPDAPGVFPRPLGA